MWFFNKKSPDCPEVADSKTIVAEERKKLEVAFAKRDILLQQILKPVEGRDG